jgi:transposase-like protein
VGNNPAEEVRISRPERRKFTDEFKAEVVALGRSSCKGITVISRDLDLTETAVREWVKRAEVDGGTRNGLSTAEREELWLLSTPLDWPMVIGEGRVVALENGGG